MGWLENFTAAAERGVQDIDDPEVAAEREFMQAMGAAAVAELDPEIRSAWEATDGG